MRLTVLRRLGTLISAAVAACVMAAPIAHAQDLYGSIVGTITDSTGATLPGATVTIEQSETKLTPELVTDSSGVYHFTAVSGPGYANWDVGIFRDIQLPRKVIMTVRVEVFNALDTAHFNNPGGNVSNLQLNPDGTIRNLNGFAEVTSAYGERQARLGVRLGW